MQKIISVLLVFILYIPSFFSQDITFQNLTPDDGLSQVSVNDLYLDERGFIWVGTREGLNCYNGNNIITYKSQKNNLNSLFSNNILKITGNQKGKIYLLCLDGLSEWDISKEKFTTVLESPDLTAIHYNKQLYIGKFNRIYKMQENQEISVFFELPDKESIISTIFIDEKGLIWVGTSNHGLYKINILTKQVKHLVDKANITSIYEDRDKNIWVGSWEHGMYRFTENECMRYLHNTSNNSISSNFVRACCQDDQGNIWIGTFEGLDKFDLKTGQFNNYSAAQSSGMTHNSIWNIIKDRQGTIWFGTYFGGVNYFNPDYEIYTHYRATNKEKEGLSSPVVGKMTEDNKGNLWICTEGGGVNVYNRNTGQFKWYQHDKSTNSISHNNVKSIYFDSENDIMWMGTHLGGLNKLDLKTDKFTCFLSDENDSLSLPSNIIRDIIPYNDDLILATHNGVCLFSPKSGKSKHLFKNFEKNNIIKTVGSLFIDYYGDLWFTVSGEGVFCYNFEEEQLVQYKHELSNPNSIGNNNINHIYQDHNYNLWFSTSGSGLDLFDYKNKNFKNYDSQKNGIVSDCIYEVCESRFGGLLLITNLGFSHFDISNQKFYNYNKHNGFPLSTINENALYLTSDGEVFLGGVQGMVSFYEKDLRLPKKNYDIILYRLIVNNKIVEVNDETGILDSSLCSVSDITLGSEYSVFSIEFAATNYIPSNRDKIVYRLEGFSDNWININGQNMITYTNLNPGDYTLVIKADNDDPESIPVARLNITILPPFYKTTYAYFIYFVVVISLLYYFIKSYKKRVELQESLKYEQKHIQDIEDLNQSKLRFFTNISHEFRTPLTLIIGQLESIMQIESFTPKVYNKLLSVYNNSLQLKVLIGELLDFRKQEQGHITLQVSEHNIVDFLEEIFLLFSGYASSQGIDLVFNKKTEMLNIWFDEKQIQKVLNNLLSNALKYTPSGGTITIIISQTESNEALIEVCDTGNGIDTKDIDKIFDRFYQSSTSLSGTGIGLALSKGIVEMHKGRITAKSEINKGSQFCVYLKPGKEHFDKIQVADQKPVFLSEEPTIPLILKEQHSIGTFEYNILPKVEGAKILIVEDNASLQQMLVQIFEPFYIVSTASDGQEGLQKVRQEAPNLVLSDVLMPLMSGVELCKEIKSDLDICHIPVVLLTARTTVENMIEGFQYGADDYITKPFDVNLLISRCNNLVNSRILLHEKFSQQPQMTPWMLATNKLDQELLDKVMDIINKNIGNPDFSVDQLAGETGMARTNLYAKIKAVTGQTPNKFILTLRLKKSALLLRNNPEMRISEISDITGFASAGYFGKCFKEYFNTTPMAYRTDNAENEMVDNE